MGVHTYQVTAPPRDGHVVHHFLRHVDQRHEKVGNGHVE